MGPLTYCWWEYKENYLSWRTTGRIYSSRKCAHLDALAILILRASHRKPPSIAGPVGGALQATVLVKSGIDVAIRQLDN